jgi:hypothetical protein
MIRVLYSFPIRTIRKSRNGSFLSESVPSVGRFLSCTVTTNPKNYFDIISARKASNKKAVGINFSPEVIDCFKELADETGLPYQKLIDLYLLDCAKRRRKLSLKWVA